MSLQNRVTPFGEIVAIPQRGMFTGNRGIIHDPATKTLLNRRYTSKAWLVCSCEYKGYRRVVMAGRSWTELFFLDEAVALAAGHRPCFVCRREAAQRFKALWASANDMAGSSADAMDRVLHEERIDHGQKRVHSLPRRIAALPNGAIVVASGAAYTLCSGQAYRWTSEGYAAPERLDDADGLLTPSSTLRVIDAGYQPELHPSIWGV
jgi:hypothetical protein